MAEKKTLMEEIQQVLKELAEESKKTEAAQQKTEAALQEVAQESKKTETALQEVAQESKKTETALQDLKTFAQEISADNKRRVDKLEKLFTGEWGKLVESLVKGGVVQMFNQRNIRINDIAREREKRVGDATYEFDIIAVDGDEMVVVEVKSTLNLEDLDHFTEKMQLFRTIFGEYRDKKKIHGAVAYLKENRGAAKRAMAEGLWVIRATGDSSSIINPENFDPKFF